MQLGGVAVEGISNGLYVVRVSKSRERERERERESAG